MPTQSTCFYQILLDDHRRTEPMLNRLQRLASETGQLQALQTLFQELGRELLIHFALEEHALFPVLSQYRTMMLMEVEHNSLLNAQDTLAHELQQSLTQGEATSGLQTAADQFADTLKAHIREEESGVFTLADQCLEPEEKALVQRKLETLHQSLLADPHPERAVLHRPAPGYAIHPGRLLQPPARPITYDKLFDREHASMFQVQLQAGQRLKTHMAGEHQAVVVVTGCARFMPGEREETLSAGQMITMDPRLPYALEALEDTTLLVFKVWPKPHFIRQ